MSYLEHYVVYFHVAKLITSKIQDLQVHLDEVIISTLINKCRKKEEVGEEGKGYKQFRASCLISSLSTSTTSRTLGNS